MHPAMDHSGIYTATGLQAYLERNRRHLIAGYDATSESSAALKLAIVRMGGGNWWAMGIDTKWAAAKIARPIQHAADLQLEAGRALATAWEIYLGTLGQPGTKRGHAREFNPGA